MKSIQFSFVVNNEVTSVDTLLADTPLTRLRGLIARPPLHEAEGLLLEPCNSVHTIGMKYPLDIIYLDKDNNIIKLVQNLKPLRFSACWQAHAVLELKAGEITRLGFSPLMKGHRND